MAGYVQPLCSDELMHYGVKGMHWGVRRYQNYDGTLIHPKSGKKKTLLGSGKSSKKQVNSKYRFSAFNKNVKNMSDDELRSEIENLKKQSERKRLEEEYADLTKKPVSAKEKKAEARKEMAKKLASKFVDKTMNTLVDTAAKNIGEKVAKKLSNAVMPDKKKADNTRTEIPEDVSKLSDAELKKVEDRMKKEEAVNKYNNKKNKKDDADNKKDDADNKKDDADNKKDDADNKNDNFTSSNAPVDGRKAKKVSDITKKETKVQSESSAQKNTTAVTKSLRDRAERIDNLHVDATYERQKSKIATGSGIRAVGSALTTAGGGALLAMGGEYVAAGVIAAGIVSAVANKTYTSIKQHKARKEYDEARIDIAEKYFDLALNDITKNKGK